MRGLLIKHTSATTLTRAANNAANNCAEEFHAFFKVSDQLFARQTDHYKCLASFRRGSLE